MSPQMEATNEDDHVGGEGEPAIPCGDRSAGLEEGGCPCAPRVGCARGGDSVVAAAVVT